MPQSFVLLLTSETRSLPVHATLGKASIDKACCQSRYSARKILVGDVRKINFQVRADSPLEESTFEPCVSRRGAVISAVASLPWLWCLDRAVASEAQNALRTRLENAASASNPGNALFPSDLFYPDWFVGTWLVEARFTDFSAPQGVDLVDDETVKTAQVDKAIPIASYSLRWYTFPQAAPLASRSMAQVLSRPGGKVVQDRAYNVAAITNAYANRDIVKQVVFDPSNPQRESVYLLANNRCEIFLNNRSGASSSPDDFTSQEYLRQVLLRRGRPPVVHDYEILVSYQRDGADPDLVLATQKILMYLTPMHPQFFQAANRPVAISSYELTLRRQSSADVPPRVRTQRRNSVERAPGLAAAPGAEGSIGIAVPLALRAG